MPYLCLNLRSIKINQSNNYIKVKVMNTNCSIRLLALILILLINPFGVFAQKELKVYISVDMEGVAGVVSTEHVRETGNDYNLARMWATQEVNAAIEGALEAGATTIVVNDSHGNMRNIIAHEVNPAARLISGTSKPLGMMQGLDESFHAVILIGYHGRAGSIDGVLDHTYSGASVHALKVNGIEIGEAELNALIAGQMGVPIVLVAGDRAACEQAKKLLHKNLVTIEVKEGIGRFAANSLVPQAAQKKIKEGVRKALENRQSIKPYKLDGPFTFDVDFLYSNQAAAAELIPGVNRTGPRSVKYTQPDFIEGFKLFTALVLVAR